MIDDRRTYVGEGMRDRERKLLLIIIDIDR